MMPECEHPTALTEFIGGRHGNFWDRRTMILDFPSPGGARTFIITLPVFVVRLAYRDFWFDSSSRHFGDLGPETAANAGLTDAGLGPVLL